MYSALSRRIATYFLLTSLSLVLTGCPNGRNNVSSPDQLLKDNPLKLRVLVIDDPGFANALEEFWQTQGEGELTVRQKTSSEIRPDQHRVGADILVFPSHMLPELASRRLLSPVPSETWATDVDGNDLLPTTRKLSFYDDKSYAVPLASSHFVLGYRTDIFEENGLAAPTTWTDYMAAVAKLAATSDQVSPTSEPLGPFWRSEILLARNGCFVKQRNATNILFETKKLQPQLNHLAGQRALQQIQEVAKCNPKQLQLTPTDTLKQLLEGKSAMAITTANASLQVKSLDAPLSIEFLPLPGCNEYYSIRDSAWHKREQVEYTTLLGSATSTAAVTFESPFKSAAFKLIATLANEGGYQKVSRHSVASGITRTSQLRGGENLLPPNVGNTTAKSCQAAIESNLTRPATYTVRLPERAEYMKHLDSAIEASCNGADSSQQLKIVEQEWNEIIDRCGRDKVLEIYRNSVDQ